MKAIQEWLKTKTPIILDYDAGNIGDDMNQRMLVKEHFTETYLMLKTNVNLLTLSRYCIEHALKGPHA